MNNMKKIFILISLATALLVGCSSEPKGTFEGVKVLDKRMEEQCSRGCWNDYYIKFEKNGDVVELETDLENVFNLFEKGNTVNVTYDEDYFIIDVGFPNMDEKKSD